MAVDIDKETESESLVEVQLAIDKLFHLRDNFFKTYSYGDAANKPDIIRKGLLSVQEIIEKNAEKISKSNYYLLVGKANNVLPDFSLLAFEALSKAVKLDPSSVEAWNLLGECFWKKGDIQSAKNCFTDALKWKTNKHSLRGVSMTIRALTGTVSSSLNLQERISHLEDSLERAKQAVALDPTDGQSWMCLGNAYMSMFFVSTNKRSMLQHTLQAYNQAEKDASIISNPDLYYNRAMLYRYLCEYKSTIADLTQAIRLDPLWPDPRLKMDQVVTFLQTITNICKDKGKLKPKRLQQMIQNISDLDLGHYKDAVGGSKLKRVNLADIQPGHNSGVVVLGKTVAFAKADAELAFCLCDSTSDVSQSCMGAVVHNMASDLMKVGDSVAIPEPTVIAVECSFQDLDNSQATVKEFKMNLIRLETPYGLVISRRPVAADKVSVTNFSFFNVPE